MVKGCFMDENSLSNQCMCSKTWFYFRNRFYPKETHTCTGYTVREEGSHDNLLSVVDLLTWAAAVWCTHSCMAFKVKPKHLDYPLVAWYYYGKQLVFYELSMHFKHKYRVYQDLFTCWKPKLWLWLKFGTLQEPCQLLVNKTPKVLIWIKSKCINQNDLDISLIRTVYWSSWCGLLVCQSRILALGWHDFLR